MEDEDDLGLDPEFASRFERAGRGPCQLYLISPARLDQHFDDQLRAAIGAGPVAAFQLRMKDAPDEEILRTAERLMPICAGAGVAFILNDRMDWRKPAARDGVIWVKETAIRAKPAAARILAQIGVTCHDSRHLAMEAGEAGADYVAFGAFFPTNTKDVFHRPGALDPRVVDDAFRASLRRDRGDHPRKCACSRGSRRRFPRRLRVRLVASGRPRGSRRRFPDHAGESRSRFS
jgi:thiamine-phosphate pyrophosphorylase